MKVYLVIKTLKISFWPRLFLSMRFLCLKITFSRTVKKFRKREAPFDDEDANFILNSLLFSVLFFFPGSQFSSMSFANNTHTSCRNSLCSRNRNTKPEIDVHGERKIWEGVFAKAWEERRNFSQKMSVWVNKVNRISVSV